MVSPIGKDHWLTRSLEQQPDLVHTELWAVVKPVHHFVRRITVYDLAEEKGFYGVWSIQSLWAPLFPTELEDTIGFSMSLTQGPAIVIFPELMPEPIEYKAFQDHIECSALPLLRSIDSMERLHREIAQRQANLIDDIPQSEFCRELAMGDFDAARKLLEQNRDDWFQENDNYFEEQELDQLRQLCRLLDDGNYGKIARRLHEWETLAAENSELGDLWQPAPFPFEPEYKDWLKQSGSA